MLGPNATATLERCPSKPCQNHRKRERVAAGHLASPANENNETKLANRGRIGSTLLRRMMTKPEVEAEKRFVPAVLPWLIAVAAGAFFGATLNHWVSFSSLHQTARASGWIWQGNLGGPVCWLLMYPLRWLPPGLVPLGVNLFSLVCAALTLAVLARSVALLPHDRTQEQRAKVQNEASILSGRIGWLPPLLAALVCGLQLTFWENATTGSGQPADLLTIPFANHCEMLDLLLFAVVIQCLLEFRVSLNEAWLYRASLVYALGVTGNWAMILFFPVFVIALVWLKKAGFFNAQFLTRVLLWTLAGLAFYLLLPLVQNFAEVLRVPFWTGLKAELTTQKMAIASVYQYFNMFRQEALLLALTSLLPIFIISIRWASYFGDDSRIGIWTTTLMFHVVHALFLGICVWVALDPSFSPRNKHYWMPCLTLAYLGALSVGYFSGYFLLLFGGRVPARTHILIRLGRQLVTTAIGFLLFGVPALLLWRNLPQMRLTNGPMLAQYAAAQAQALPAGKGLILSDDPLRLVLLESWLSTHPQGKDYLFLNTSALPWPDYHRHLAQRYGARWPAPVPNNPGQRLDDLELIALISNLAASNSVYYLHPSFGYYFEVFDLEPHGMVYKLNFCSSNAISTPRLPPSLVDANEAFWAQCHAATLRSLAAGITPREPTNLPPFLKTVLTRLHLEPEANREATQLGPIYARALDWWGVQMQRRGDLGKAAPYFDLAQELNPDNVAAAVNLEVNQSLRRGEPLALGSLAVEERFGRHRRWDQVLNESGPFDAPSFCFRQGLVFSQGRLYRQAAHEFERVRALLPDNLDARLLLAKMNLLRGFTEQTLTMIADIHAKARPLGLTRTNLPAVLLVETAAHLSRKDVAGAESAVRAALAQYPGDVGLLATAARVYLNYGFATNALASIRAALQQQPGDAGLHLMAAQVYGRAKDLANLDHSLQAALAKNPADETVLAAASDLYLANGLFSNVVAVCDRQVQINPANSQALAADVGKYCQRCRADGRLRPSHHQPDLRHGRGHEPNRGGALVCATQSSGRLFAQERPRRSQPRL